MSVRLLTKMIMLQDTNTCDNASMLDDRDFSRLLELYNRPWSGYRKVRKGVMRRIRKHMKSLGSGSVVEYLEALRENDGENRLLQSHLRVTISRFNRDRQVWVHLRDEVLPSLLQGCESLQVWSAGCSCGEEPYSLSILWQSTFAPFSKLTIVATDAEERCLRRARQGRYPSSSLKELPPEVVAGCFKKTGSKDEFEILEQYKTNITWQHHDLLTPPPGDTFNIIFLRNNLLTYYQDPLLSSALQRILAVLSNGGFLIVGSHEELPANIPHNLQQVFPSIYKLLS